MTSILATTATASNASPQGRTAPVAPTPRSPARLAVAPDAPAVASDAHADAQAVSFGKAILVGVGLGIPLMALAIVVGVKLVAPASDVWSLAAIAVWVSLFCGPFLAGTVTVGLASRHLH